MRSLCKLFWNNYLWLWGSITRVVAVHGCIHSFWAGVLASQKHFLCKDVGPLYKIVVLAKSMAWFLLSDIHGWDSLHWWPSNFIYLVRDWHKRCHFDFDNFHLTMILHSLPVPYIKAFALNYFFIHPYFYTENCKTKMSSLLQMTWGAEQRVRAQRSLQRSDWLYWSGQHGSSPFII
jgi:hypothetical protein